MDLLKFPHIHYCYNFSQYKIYSISFSNQLIQFSIMIILYTLTFRIKFKYVLIKFK